MQRQNYEGDAEWVDVDREIPELEPRSTRRPRVHPPRTTPWFTTPSYTTPRYAEDAPERLPPDAIPSAEEHSDATAIIAGVLGGIMGVALIFLTFYLLVLRKKLTKVKGENKTLFNYSRKPREDDYKIRVEDITHLDHLEESGPLYVNTTDIQRLVSTVKEKKKKEHPQSDVVFVTPPIAASDITINSTNIHGHYYSNPTADECHEAPVVVRPAPAPPVKRLDSNTVQAKDDFKSSSIKPRPRVSPPSPPVTEKSIPQVSLRTISDKFSASPSLKKTPPSLPAISKPSIQPIADQEPNDPSNQSLNVIKPKLPTTSKPELPKANKPELPKANKPEPPKANKPVKPELPINNKPEVPKTSKPKPPPISVPHVQPAPPIVLTQPDGSRTTKIPPEVLPKPKKPRSPLLPPIRVDLKPTNTLHSGCNTPDTALTDLETPDTSSAGVSVSARKALLEGKFMGFAQR